jgi:hypothetical protein
MSAGAGVAGSRPRSSWPARYAVVHASFAVHGGTEVLLVGLVYDLVR